MTDSVVARASTGVPGLDEVLNGGLPENRAFMLRGGPGSGKTILGEHFLTANEDDTSLFVSLEESAANLRANARSVGIDLDDDWSTITEQVAGSEYTRLPVFDGGIDNIRGVLHVRRVLTAMLDGELTRERLLEHVRDPYFVPEGTPLHRQMLNFQAERRRIGLVVDEYGEFLGLVTLEDILEEIVGEFTTDPAEAISDIHRQPDGSYLAAGSASVRELKRLLEWDLPVDGPKTLNGLILEHLETIPESGTSLLIDDHPVTVLQTEENRVKVARLERRVRPRAVSAERGD